MLENQAVDGFSADAKLDGDVNIGAACAVLPLEGELLRCCLGDVTSVLHQFGLDLVLDLDGHFVWCQLAVLDEVKDLRFGELSPRLSLTSFDNR